MQASRLSVAGVSVQEKYTAKDIGQTTGDGTVPAYSQVLSGQPSPTIRGTIAAWQEYLLGRLDVYVLLYISLFDSLWRPCTKAGVQFPVRKLRLSCVQ
jgi:hypothetical protein